MAEVMTTKLNPTKGPLLPGVKIDDHLVVCSIPATLLFRLALDPRDAEDKKKVSASRDLQRLAEMREDVQRLFENQKRRNVPSYASYICALTDGADGMTPPIILYSEVALETDYNESGLGYVQVPWEQYLIAIDGETQLAARHEARNMWPETSKGNVAVVVAHGFNKNWARQSFHDLNVLGVKPNTALGIGMDTRDPLTGIAREVEASVPFLKGRVNKSRRQLKTTDTDIMTITALRGACTTLAEGISGVKHGSKPVVLPEKDIPRIAANAKDWFKAVTEVIGPEMEDRENKLAVAPSILAAIGAMGHSLLNLEGAERAEKKHELLESLRRVDWRRSKAWEGIAGKFTPKGAFAVGGSKETAYAVYDALMSQGSSAYKRVHRQPAEAAE